jgi:MinD-like ATPase involved in chromosome partitioning or flagellar assembly
MIHLGALMSQDLVDDLVLTLQGTALSVVNLGPCASGVLASDALGLDALVVELSESVCDADPRQRVSAPIAGIPVGAHSDDIAARHAIELVLRGPEDLEEFIEGVKGDVEPRGSTPGHIVAFWGPAGAPGRTTLAVATAALLAMRTQRVVLIDADTYAPAIAPLMGLSSPHPGIIAASRIGRVEGIDSDTLVACCVPFVGAGLSLPVMTGLRSPTQFADCGGPSWARVLAAFKEAGYVVVLDVGAPIEQFPHEVVGGPLRNAVAMASLQAADTVVAVARAEPLSIMRLSRAWPRYRELSPESSLHTVLNAHPPHSSDALEEGAHALWQFTGQQEVASIPHDRTLAHSAGGSAEAIIASARGGVLATGLVGVADAIAPVAPVIRGSGRGSGAGVRGGGAVGWVSRWLPGAGKRLL